MYFNLKIEGLDGKHHDDGFSSLVSKSTKRSPWNYTIDEKKIVIFCCLVGSIKDPSVAIDIMPEVSYQ